jgi:biopolymer transport protein ExbD
MPKIKGSGGGVAKIDINMTPMIDVVFQLLTFFLMTFKVASPEGDFNLKLPKEERSQGAANTQTEMINIRLVARPTGDLAQIQIESGAPITGPQAFNILHNNIVKMVNIARGAGQQEPEIQIDADDILRYENIVLTVSAVSGQIDENTGEIIPLVKKIKFAPK